MKLASTAFGLGLTALALTQAQAQLFSANLLQNPGAETGDLSHWTTSGSSQPFVDSGTFNAGLTAHSGAFAFVGGRGETTGELGKLTQAVAIDSIFGTAAIDSGVVSARLTFEAQSLNQSPNSDSPAISLNFLNGASVSLGLATTPEVTSNDAWLEHTQTFAIPAGTRVIEYTMEFHRHAGSDNDAYVDDNSLQLAITPTTVPEPSEWAAAGGLLLLGFATARRLKR